MGRNIVCIYSHIWELSNPHLEKWPRENFAKNLKTDYCQNSSILLESLSPFRLLFRVFSFPFLLVTFLSRMSEIVVPVVIFDFILIFLVTATGHSSSEFRVLHPDISDHPTKFDRFARFFGWGWFFGFFRFFAGIGFFGDFMMSTIVDTISATRPIFWARIFALVLLSLSFFPDNISRIRTATIVTIVSAARVILTRFILTFWMDF